MTNWTIRPILPADNAALATIIRSTLEEFGANHPGTVYFDESTDHLFTLFDAAPNAMYWVAVDDNGIAGGGGIFPTEGLPEKTCELVKLYLLPRARGKGIGKALIEHCHQTALQFGFTQIYLETMPELTIAIPLYEKMGYIYTDSALGCSGHFGCSVHMLRHL